jgi:phosphoglucosamine mutase
MHPGAAARAVRETGAFAGVSLDGDGDRAILVDETGTVRDGDFVLASLGRRMKAAGALPGDTVVGTVMSNIGLEVALGGAGVHLHRTAVGDRHIAAALRGNGWALGGEPSGHVIFRGPDGLYPGDGILTALNVLAAALAEDVPLSRLAGAWRAFPQVLINVPVPRKVPFDRIEGFDAEADAVRDALGDEGRVVLRYSGTEPVARVMVEGPDEGLVRGYAERLAERIERGIEP